MSGINEKNKENQIKNRNTKVGLCHYQIAAYAILKHLFLPKYKEKDKLKPVLFFFSAHIGDAVIFLDALKEYQTLYSKQNGYRFVLACRKEVKDFLEQMNCFEVVEYIEINRDEILRSYSKFKKAVKEASKYQYYLYINPRVVSVIEYVFEYCISAKYKHIVRVDGDQSKNTLKERFFRDSQKHEVTFVTRDMMLIKRIYALLDKLSGKKHCVRVSRLNLPECEIELPKRYCVFAPSTAETPSKCWPAENYAKLIDEIVEKYDIDICLSGGKADSIICQRVLEKVINKSRVYNYVGNTDFKQWITLIGRSELVVCNDSSPMHIAVATGRPCVCIGGQWEGSCYYPYIVDELREDDILPKVVLGEKLPCYYCTLTTQGRMGNPECKESIERAEAYPCIRNVKYNDVWEMVSLSLETGINYEAKN